MTLTRHSSINPVLLSLTCAVLGMAAAVLTGFFGVVAALIALVLTAPLVLRGDRLAALAGLLIGFGGLWLWLLGSENASGGQLSDPAPWDLLGAAPLAIGLGALVLRLARVSVRRMSLPNAD
jgi:hypothetical protein